MLKTYYENSENIKNDINLCISFTYRLHFVQDIFSPNSISVHLDLTKTYMYCALFCPATSLLAVVF